MWKMQCVQLLNNNEIMHTFTLEDKDELIKFPTHQGSYWDKGWERWKNIQLSEIQYYKNEKKRRKYMY